MKGNKLLQLIVLSLTWLLSEAFHTLVPKGKELVYDYHAVIRAGTNLPQPYGSELHLIGKLHLQAHPDNATLVRLSDLAFKLYNGQIHPHHDHQIDEIPLPQNCEDLLRVFKIHYDSPGQVKGISTEKREMTYVVNIKKAIAAILQLDLQKIDLTRTSFEEVKFVVDELTIYGNNSVAYTVRPQSEDEEVVVEKVLEMKTTQSMYQNVIHNIAFDYCESDHEEPLSRDSRQRYVVDKEHQLVRSVKAIGGIYVNPLQGKSIVQYVLVNQSFDLIDVGNIHQQFEVHDEQYEEGIQYHLSDLVTLGVGLTHAQIKTDVQRKISIIYNMLRDFLQESDQDFYNIQKGERVNTIVRLLTTLDDAAMEQLHQGLVDWSPKDHKYRKIFYQLLPLVGTHPSVRFIKKSIKQHVVDEEVAVDMLQTFPIYVKAPTKDLLQEVDDLIRWDDGIAWDVRKAAILSFTTLIHNSFRYHLHLNQDDQDLNYRSNVLPDLTIFFAQHKIYVKYINDLGKKLETSKSLDEQLLYVNALFNTRVYTAIDYLTPIIQVGSTYHRKVQVVALWAISSITYRDYQKVYDIFWPIAINNNLPIEVQTTAYFIIMESHPPLWLLFKIHWYLQNKLDSDLYHFHYAFLKSLASNNALCHQNFKLDAARMLRLMSKPNRKSISGYYQADFHDVTYGFGGGFHCFIMDFGSSKIVLLERNIQAFTINRFTFTIMIQINGLPKELSNLTLENILNVNRDTLKTLISNVEMATSILHHDRVLQTYYCNNCNVQDLNPFSDWFKTQNSLQVYYDLSAQIFLPTDLGILAVMEIMTPTIYQKSQNVTITNKTSGFTQSINMVNAYRFAKLSHYGLSFYNPISDAWQGIHRHESFQIAFPISANLQINADEASLRFSFKTLLEDLKNAVDVQSRVVSVVFIYEDLHEQILTKSCLQCRNWEPITRGKRFWTNDTWEGEFSSTGYVYQLSTYADGNRPKVGRLQDLLRSFEQDVLKSHHTPIDFALVFVDYWYMYSTLLPDVVDGGYVFTVSPTKNNSVESIELMLQIETGAKCNIYGTYSLINHETSTKLWDIKTKVVEADLEHDYKGWTIDFHPSGDDQKVYTVNLVEALNLRGKSIIDKGNDKLLQTDELHKLKRSTDLTKICSATEDSRQEAECANWVMYLGDLEGTSRYGIYLRKVIGTDLMAMKIVFETHVMEVYPGANRYTIVVDGQLMSDTDDYSAEWFSYELRTESHRIIVKIHTITIYLEFTGREIYIEVPKALCRLFFR